MGAVTLTAHPIPSPTGPSSAAGSAQPGVMTRQGSGSIAPTDGRPCRTGEIAQPTPTPPDPAVIQVDRRRLPGGTPELGQATAGSRPDPQPGRLPSCRKAPDRDARSCMPMSGRVVTHKLIDVGRAASTLCSLL